MKKHTLILFIIVGMFILPIIGCGSGGRTEGGVYVKESTLMDFPYSYQKKSNSLLKLYMEAMGTSITDYIKIENNTTIFTGVDVYEEPSPNRQSRNLLYGKLKKGKATGKCLILEYSTERGHYLPEYLGELKNGKKDGYGITFGLNSTYSHVFQVIEEGIYKKGKLQEGVSYDYGYADYWEMSARVEKEFHDRNKAVVCDFSAPILFQYKKFEGEYKSGEYYKGVMYYSDGSTKYKGKFKDGEPKDASKVKEPVETNKLENSDIFEDVEGNSQTENIIEEKEYVCWDDEQEIYITLEYVSEESGIWKGSINFFDESQQDLHVESEFALSEYTGIYDVYDDMGNLSHYKFEICHDVEDGVEIEYMNLIDDDTGYIMVLLEKGYAINNVG